MSFSLTRRFVLSGGLVLASIAAAGCESVPGLGSDEVIRRLLLQATDRALARLSSEAAFAIEPPAGAESLRAELSRAAAAATQAAARPVLRRGIDDLATLDGPAILSGGPTAATAFLQRSLGEALFEAIAPAIGEALQSGAGAGFPAGGVNPEGLRLDVARQASKAIYRAIGEEEAALRAADSSIGSGRVPIL